MLGTLRSVCLVLVAVGSWNSAAFACSAPLAKTDAQIRGLARDVFAEADVVADVVVEMAANPSPDLLGAMPMAAVRPVKVWKGDVPDLVGIPVLSTCDVPLEHKGARHRLVLNRVGDDEWLLRVDNIANGATAQNRRVFDDEIDQLIGNQRGPEFRDVGNWPHPSKTAMVFAAPSPFRNRTVQLAGLAIALLSSLLTWLALRMKAQNPNAEST